MSTDSITEPSKPRVDQGCPEVGWGWPHLQSRAGSRRANADERRRRGCPRPGVERHTCVVETEGGASPTLRASRDACRYNSPPL